MSDILVELGPVFLGSRLKRVAERLQAGAARVIAEAGLPVQPTHMPLLAALERGPLTVGGLVEAVGSSQPGVTRGVGQLVAIGLVASTRGRDARRRTLELTDAGRVAMVRTRMLVWPGVERAVADMCAGLSGPLLDQIGGLEAALGAASLDARVAAEPRAPLSIREYSDDLAADFRDINVEWISTSYHLEPTDFDVLDHPRERIIETGGAVLFVEAPKLGVIGCCALRRAGGAAIELIKMGVRPSARGLKVGEFLLAAAIARAAAVGADPLYLLTNKRAEAAIHLYEKLGFRHDARIMAEYGATYTRCDVAMRYVGTRSDS